jgi:hypothetical protein
LDCKGLICSFCRGDVRGGGSGRRIEPRGPGGPLDANLTPKRLVHGGRSFLAHILESEVIKGSVKVGLSS